MHQRGRSAGFTLLEVLIALTILTIALTVIFRVLGTQLIYSAKNAAEDETVLAMRSVLEGAAASAPLQEGETTGAAGNRIRWRLTVRPFGSEDEQAVWPVSAFELTVTAQNNAGGNPISMSTVRLQLRISP